MAITVPRNPFAFRLGQAMVETVVAVLIVSCAFLALFKLSYLLTGKILVQHAAMRTARARAVGLNDFLCLKTARVATIPAAGKRTWPEGGDFADAMELARVPVYMGTPDGATARGVLDYEGWDRLSVRPAAGGTTEVSLGFELFDGLTAFRLSGEAQVEDNFSLYMNDGGR